MTIAPCAEVRLDNLERSEGGAYGDMFQFTNMLLWTAERAPATETGEKLPFVCVDINGAREDGSLAVTILRLDRNSAVRMRDALTAVLT